MNESDDMTGDDRMIIEKMRLPARVGVYAHEKDRTQTICLSLEIGLPRRDRHLSDALEDTICYMAVTQAVRALAVGRHFNLVETLAEHMAHAVLDHGALWVAVRVGKVGIVPGAQAADIAITRRRRSTHAQAAAPLDMSATAH